MTYFVTNKKFLFPGFCAFKSECSSGAVAALTRVECRKTANSVIILKQIPLGHTCAPIVVTGTHYYSFMFVVQDKYSW